MCYRLTSQHIYKFVYAVITLRLSSWTGASDILLHANCVYGSTGPICYKQAWGGRILCQLDHR